MSSAALCCAQLSAAARRVLNALTATGLHCSPPPAASCSDVCLSLVDEDEDDWKVRDDLRMLLPILSLSPILLVRSFW